MSYNSCGEWYCVKNSSQISFTFSSKISTSLQRASSLVHFSYISEFRSLCAIFCFLNWRITTRAKANRLQWSSSKDAGIKSSQLAVERSVRLRDCTTGKTAGPFWSAEERGVGRRGVESDTRRRWVLISLENQPRNVHVQPWTYFGMLVGSLFLLGKRKHRRCGND